VRQRNAQGGVRQRNAQGGVRQRNAQGGVRQRDAQGGVPYCIFAYPTKICRAPSRTP